MMGTPYDPNALSDANARQAEAIESLQSRLAATEDVLRTTGEDLDEAREQLATERARAEAAERRLAIIIESIRKERIAARAHLEGKPHD